MAKRNGGNRRTGRDAAPVRPLPPGASAKTGQSGARSCLIVFAVVLALICLLAASVARCTTTSESSPDSRFFHFGSEGTYDWTCLNTVNGRYAYYADGTRLSRFGIDVSDSQGYIEWADVANDGVEFAMVRCGYRGITDGGVYEDQYFDWNIDNASAQGIDVGVYFFSQAISEEEAVEEANKCLEMIDGRKLQYPVAYDYEPSTTGGGRADSLSAEQASANARAFCKVIEDAGYSTMIYGNQHDLNDYESGLLDESEIWYAEYGTLAPTSNHRFSIWQYSNEGSIAGIDTAVDMNIDLSAG